eukprot:363877-Chlamydomonas_euryale.AAC.6
MATFAPTRGVLAVSFSPAFFPPSLPPIPALRPPALLHLLHAVPSSRPWVTNNLSSQSFTHLPTPRCAL